MREILLQIISNQIHSIRFDQSWNGISDQGLGLIVSALLQNPDHGILHQLVVRSASITSSSGYQLRLLLQINAALSLLDLSHNQLSGRPIFVQGLRHNTNLETLNLSYNSISGFPEMISINLVKLYLRHNHITSEGMRTLACALETNHSLKVLDLAFNLIDDKGANYLIPVLCHHPCLHVLRLSNNRIGYMGMLHISVGIAANCSVISLDLAANRIDCEVNFRENGSPVMDLCEPYPEESSTVDHSTDELWRFLRSNTTLKSLDLSENRLGTRGIITLANALSTNTTLQRCRLNSTTADARGIHAMKKALVEKPELLELSLDGNEETEDLQLIETLVKRNLHNHKMKNCFLFQEIFDTQFLSVSPSSLHTADPFFEQTGISLEY